MKLVFSHLGRAKARHLIPNIQRTKVLFPDYEIDLILSDMTSIKKIPDFVTVHIYKPKQETLSILDKLEHDSKFRGGFWRFSLERIFALEQVHKISPEIPILHIESDVMLFPNVPLQDIAKNPRLAWNFYNEDHDVSALLFSPNYVQTKKLVTELQTLMKHNPHLTDMTALSSIRNRSLLDVDLFSSIHISLPQLANLNAAIGRDHPVGIGFGGIFDGAAIGMWLLGHDPRNNYGKSKIHDCSPIKNGNSWINPEVVNYKLTDSGHLFATSVENPDIRVPIWNLHVHSKNQKLLSNKWGAEIEKYVKFTQNKGEIKSFDFAALIQMFLDSITTRTITRFFLGSPPLHHLRRKLLPVKIFFRKCLKD